MNLYLIYSLRPSASSAVNLPRIPQNDFLLKSGQHLVHDASQSDGLRSVNEQQAGDYDTSLS